MVKTCYYMQYLNLYQRHRKKLEDLKKDIFDLNLDIIEFFNKYGIRIIENINELKTLDNISYFRSRNFKSNKYVQDKLVDIPEKF